MGSFLTRFPVSPDEISLKSPIIRPGSKVAVGNDVGTLGICTLDRTTPTTTHHTTTMPTTKDSIAIVAEATVSDGPSVITSVGGSFHNLSVKLM